jgi:hypothetical protein
MAWTDHWKAILIVLLLLVIVWWFRAKLLSDSVNQRLDTTVAPAVKSVKSTVCTDSFDPSVSQGLGVYPLPPSRQILPQNQLEPIDDYESYMYETGLDSSVVASQAAFVKDLNRLTTTASANTLMEPVDEVPWVGLRRTDYARAKVGDESRIVPGLTNDNLPTKNSVFVI